MVEELQNSYFILRKEKQEWTKRSHVLSKSKTSKLISNLRPYCLSCRHAGAALLTSRTTKAHPLLSGHTKKEVLPSSPAYAGFPGAWFASEGLPGRRLRHSSHRLKLHTCGSSWVEAHISASASFRFWGSSTHTAPLVIAPVEAVPVVPPCRSSLHRKLCSLGHNVTSTWRKLCVNN